MHKSDLSLAFISFLILTSHLAPILSTTITPYQIDDLFSTDQASFAAEAAGWTAYPTQLTTYVYSNCGGTYVVGGYGVGAGSNQEALGSYFTRTYYGLAPHTMIYFSFQLWAIDSWDLGSSDGFNLYFSGTSLSGFPLDLYTFGANLCGNSGWGESIMTVQGNVQHISSILEFRIYNHFDEASDNESLGIRQITFMMSDAPAQANALCSPNTPNTSYRCTNSCPDGYYWNGVGCAGCDYYCAKCFGSGTTNCYQCQNGAVWDGSQCIVCSNNCATCYGGASNQCLTCTSSYPYMYNQNTCLNACASPLALTSGSTGLVCGLPCSENQYLYPDGTCLVECDFPLEAYTTTTPIGVVNRCKSPCTGSDYMYWEADCRATCNFPLTAITQYGINYCEFPCDPSTLILYWNGTCETSCDFPLEYANRFSAAFCDYPCADNEYLYDNGTCSSICQQYFLTDAVDDPSGKLYCYYPCSSTQTLYNNGSCLGTCDWRFTNFTLWPDWYCDYPCSSTQYLYTNGSCLDTCDPRFGLTTDSVTGDQYCNYPCDDTQYLDSNGTCSESCDNYFYPYYLWDEKYCDYPCQATQYLLNNGTCVNNCNSDYPYFNPLSVSGPILRTGAIVIENYCSYPCLSNQYLYSNGSCFTFCQPNYAPSIYSLDKFCDYPCQSTEYLYYNGSCLSSCPIIFDSYPLTPPSSELYCANPCKPPDFIYPNGTCLSYCPVPYVQEMYGADSYCIFPCSTSAPIEFLYRDGSCESTCLSYYSQRVEGNEHFCDYPCEPGDYLYYNHTCLSSCTSPFVLNVVNGENFCDHPCTTTSDFIYWNGSCLSSCSTPLQSVYEGTSNFCTYPCETDQFLSWTGICLDTCPFPLSTVKMEDGLQYCNNPCSVSEYLSWNGTCLFQCSKPFRIQDNGLGLRCELPCDDSEYYYHQDSKECKATCEKDSTLEQGIYLSCGSSSATVALLEFISTPPTEPNTITYITLANPIKYMRYLDVTMSPRLERLALSQGKAPISLLYNHGVPSEIESQLSQSIRTRLLAQTEVPASFLVNFWPEILMLAIFVFCAVIFTLAGGLAEKLGLEELRIILERFRVVLKWNIPLILLSTTLGDVILYSSFEFQTLNLDSAAAVISMLICIIFILAQLLVLLAGYFLAPRAYTLKVNSLRTQSYKDYVAFLFKWEGFQVVYRGFAVHHKLCYYFFLFYTVRMALPMLIAAYIPSPPLLQTMLFLIISIITISYLCYFRPLRKKITRIQFILSEILMLFVNIGLVILASLDLKENNSNNASGVIVIGDIIIVLSFCLCILPTVFLIIKLILIGLAAYKLRKVAPEQSKALWLQLIFVPIQQAGFGFEQVQIARHSAKYIKIDNLNLTRPRSAHEENYIIEKEESGQKHLYNVNNPAKRMRVPEIVKSNIKGAHKKDSKLEYRTFARKAVAGETLEENPDPFSVSHDLPRKKEIGRNLDAKETIYAHVYGATKGFGRVDEL